MSDDNYSDTGFLIASNAVPDSDDPRWHVAVRRLVFGPNTGKLLSSRLVTKCSKRGLGGAYGHTTIHAGQLDYWGNPCRRCEAIVARERNAFQRQARGWFTEPRN